MPVHLQRKRVLAMAHRYGNSNFDDAWNRAHFGRQTGIHGHNYTITLDLYGEVDSATGIVVNLVEVKDWLTQAVEPFADGYADAQTPALAGRQPSTESLAIVLWGRLQPMVEASPARMACVQVAESETLRSEYRGEGNVVYVTRTWDFSASHRLHSQRLSDDDNVAVFGKCNNPNGHGHNYVVEVTVKGDVDPDTGFAFPLDRLDAVVEERVLNVLDHRDLNRDVPQFAHLNPTSENLAIVVWEAIQPDIGAALHSVRIEETPRNSFEYFG